MTKLDDFFSALMKRDKNYTWYATNFDSFENILCQYFIERSENGLIYYFGSEEQRLAGCPFYVAHPRQPWIGVIGENRTKKWKSYYLIWEHFDVISDGMLTHWAHHGVVPPSAEFLKWLEDNRELRLRATNVFKVQPN